MYKSFFIPISSSKRFAFNSSNCFLSKLILIIKSILKEYLNDDSFRNFYLFFVVSNNQKGKKGDATGLETCDKQIQLLYDTRDFMDIIANENAEGVKCN